MAYLGTQPNDVKKNIGLYTPSEILQLTKDGSWGGSLELIQEQTVSGVSNTDFTSIKENVYDVHFLQFYMSEVTAAVRLQLSNDSGSSFITSGYQFALEFGRTSGTFGEDKTTSGASISDFGSGGSGLEKNAYVCLYNLGDSSKYSFATNMMFNNHPSISYYMGYGCGVLPTAETHNALRLDGVSGTMTGEAKLFGIKQL